MEYMNHRFGLTMAHVPYRSSPQAIGDVAAGHVSLSFADAGASLSLIQDGKLRALAVSSAQRLPVHPSVPPFAEAANTPDFEAVSWHVLMAPAKTPRAIVEKLHAEMKRIMSDPDMKQKVGDHRPLLLTCQSIADTEKYLATEREKWGSLVKTRLEGSQ